VKFETVILLANVATELSEGQLYVKSSGLLDFYRESLGEARALELPRFANVRATANIIDAQI
jgi:hypothetical protein